jgi:hypothetical protein
MIALYIILYLSHFIDAACNCKKTPKIAAKIAVESAVMNEFTEQHLNDHISEKTAAHSAANLLITTPLHTVLYPTYTYCEDYTAGDSCMKAGCAWCTWPDGHCQYPVIADLYPTTEYCIISQ